MSRRVAFALLAVLLVGGQAGAISLPRVPQIPVPEIPVPVEIPEVSAVLEGEPPVTTGLEDAVTEVIFLDGFDPQTLAPMGELPRGPEDEFLLVPGLFELDAQSYCLKAGAHAPGGGDGYLYAPLRGSQADAVESILRNSVKHPEIEQRDIQALLWAIIARTKFDELSPRLQEVARELLTEEQRQRLNRGALDVLPKEIKERVMAAASPLLRPVLEAENRVRELLTRAQAPFEELERSAVLFGDPPPPEGSREVPSGRWSYHPNGFFVRYLPSGYSRTRIQAYLPEEFKIEADALGRITALRDEHGAGVEVEYDDAAPALELPWDPGVRAYAFRAVRFVPAPTSEAKGAAAAELAGRGWTLVGTPSGLIGAGVLGDDLGGFRQRYEQTVRGSETLQRAFDLAALGERYDESVRHTYALRALLGNLRGLMGGPQVSPAQVADLVDLSHFVVAVRNAVSGSEWNEENRRAAAELAYKAWQAVLSDAVQGAGALGADAGMVLASYGGATDQQWALMHVMPYAAVAWERSGASGRSFGGRPKRQLPVFKPSKQVATPGNTGRQRLGQSGRPTRSAGKDAFEKAQEVIGWMGFGKNVVDVVTDPKGALAGQVAFGIHDRMYAYLFDFNFSTAAKISQAMGFDPPRSDYRKYAAVEEVDLDGIGPGQVPPERAQALQAVMRASLRLMAVERAAQVSLDRFGGAWDAGDEDWIWRQALAYVYFKRQAGEAMLEVAGRLEDLIGELRAEGIRDIVVEADTYAQYQARLTAQGFSAGEIAAARLLGLTDEEIAAEREARLAVEPSEASGSMIAGAQQAAAGFREVASWWLALPAVRPPWQEPGG